MILFGGTSFDDNLGAPRQADFAEKPFETSAARAFGANCAIVDVDRDDSVDGHLCEPLGYGELPLDGLVTPMQARALADPERFKCDTDVVLVDGIDVVARAPGKTLINSSPNAPVLLAGRVGEGLGVGPVLADVAVGVLSFAGRVLAADVDLVTDRPDAVHLLLNGVVELVEAR